MMTNTTLVAKLTTKIRAMAGKNRITVSLPGVGDVLVHVADREFARENGYAEVWCSLPGTMELYSGPRGTAEHVATQLVKGVMDRSAAVNEAAAALLTREFDGFRGEELAAMHGIPEGRVWKALDLLALRGVAEDRGALGWFKKSASV